VRLHFAPALTDLDSIWLIEHLESKLYLVLGMIYISVSPFLPFPQKAVAERDWGEAGKDASTDFEFIFVFVYF
jgi:hypothetical protein